MRHSLPVRILSATCAAVGKNEKGGGENEKEMKRKEKEEKGS